MTTDNLASRPHDYEMTLASARSAAHAFLNPTDHRQHEPRSQHRRFRTTIMKLKLYFNLHQYLPGQNLPSFWPTNSNTQTLLSKFLRTSQTFSAKKTKANQQLDTSTNPLAFDTIQTDELNPNASGDITIIPTKQPIDVSFEVDVTSSKKFDDLPKIQLSTATSTIFDTKQHKANIQNTKQKAENISGYSKNNVEPNITKNQKTPAEDNYLETYQFGNEISIQNQPYNQFPIPNSIDNMSTFTTISPGAIQQVKWPYEQPQDPFLEIQAQQIDQVLLKNRETQIGLKSSTTQNQSELQGFSATRDNVIGKQTMPAVVRPKTKMQEPRFESEEVDINVRLMYDTIFEQMCQTQTQNVQQTEMSTEKIHNYQFPTGTMVETMISSQVRNSYPTVPMSNFQMNTQINFGTSQNTMTSNKKGNNTYDANGEPLNHPFDIVNSVATRNIAHTTEDQIAGSSQSWQNFHQQQLLSNHLVCHEMANNMEPNLSVQQNRTKTINDCHSALVNQSLGLPYSDKKYTDHLQLNHRPPATTIYINSNNYQNEFSQLPGPTVPMFNDNSNPNPSHFSQLPQCLPQPRQTLQFKKT